MSTPVVLSGWLTLDALLAALLVEGGATVEDAHASVPIRETAGLFHASAARVEPVDVKGVAFCASLRAMHDIDPDLIRKNPKTGKLFRKLGVKRRRDYGNVTSHYKAILTRTVTWFCEGDKERIAALLEPVRFIGAKRQAGYGEVARWDVRPGPHDGLSADGAPLRPIPVEQFAGDADWPVIDAAYRPAYWDSRNRAACVAPERVA